MRKAPEKWPLNQLNDGENGITGWCSFPPGLARG